MGRRKDRVSHVQDASVNHFRLRVSFFTCDDSSLLGVERKIHDIFDYLKRCHLWKFCTANSHIYFYAHTFSKIRFDKLYF